MKLDRSKEWWMEKAKAEGEEPIGAGVPAPAEHDYEPPTESCRFWIKSEHPALPSYHCGRTRAEHSPMPSDPSRVEQTPREELLALVRRDLAVFASNKRRNPKNYPERLLRALEEFAAGEDTDHEFLCIKVLEILRGEA